MSKKLLLFLITISIVIIYLFSFEKTIYQELLRFNTQIQKYYISSLITLNQFYNKYFNQAEYIEQLKVENEKNLHFKLLYEQQKSSYDELSKLLTVKNSDITSNLELVDVITYYKIGDYSKLILDTTKKYKQIKALLTIDGYSAGIVLNKKDQSIGYLHQDKKSNYTVFIGNDNAPGITSGFDTMGRLVIDFVPIRKRVNLEDEVITSSMDNIFPYGIKVGKVVSIDKGDNTQKVFVKPYADTLGSRKYYLYDSNTNSLLK